MDDMISPVHWVMKNLWLFTSIWKNENARYFVFMRSKTEHHGFTRGWMSQTNYSRESLFFSVNGWSVNDRSSKDPGLARGNLLLISVIVAYLRLVEEIQSFWIFKISVCFLITIISIHVIIHKMRVRKHKLQWPRFSLSFTNWDTILSDNTLS
jgi:hypothetical protein